MTPNERFALLGVATIALAACGGPGDTSETPDSGPPMTTVDAGVPAGGDAGTPTTPDAALGDDMYVEEPRFPDEASESGTRLIRRFEVSEDGGAYRFVEFWDSELEVACTFRDAPDGQLRCLPRTGSTYVVYATSSCSGTPLFASTGCDSGFAYDSTAEALYRRGDTRAEVGELVYSESCVPLSTFETNEYWTAERMPSNRFVRAERETVERADGMVSIFAHADDGARLLLETRNAVRDYRCEFDREGRCLPSLVGAGLASAHYADSWCTNELFRQYSESGRPPLLLERRTDYRECTEGYDPFEVGEQRTGTIYRIDPATGRCSPVEPGTYYDYYYRGSPIDIRRLPAVETSLEGTGRLQVTRPVDSLGQALATPMAFWDTEWDETCRSVTLGESANLVCMSNDRGHVDDRRFANAGCTASLEFASVYRCNPRPRILAATNGNSCVAPWTYQLTTAWERGGEIPLESYYRLDYNDRCQLAETREDYDYYGAGRDITSELPALRAELDRP